MVAYLQGCACNCLYMLPDEMVSGQVFPDSDEKQHLFAGDETPEWRLLSHRMDCKAQAHAGYA